MRAPKESTAHARDFAALTARAYYNTVVGGDRIDREIEAGEMLLSDPSALRLHVDARLRALLDDVGRSVPFYRTLDCSSVRHPDDLRQLPVITRRALQESPVDFDAAPRPSGSTPCQTGGSTGTPLSFWHDPVHRARMRVDLYRGYHWCGYQPGDRALFVWGSDYDARAHRTLPGRLLDRFGYNRCWANAFRLDSADMERVIAAAAEWQPDFIIAYTTSALLVARSLGAHKLGRLRGVQVTAELLTPTVRAAIEEILGTPVFNRYGCREVGNIAHECGAHDGLHVFEDSHLVEILDDDGNPVADGVPGRIVMTNFASRATPFIRYDLGDIGRLRRGRCACGRSGARLDLVEGRVGEIVTSPSGKWIHGEFFTHLFYKVDGVQQFRVVQETLHRLRIEIECDGRLDESTMRFLDETIRREGDPAFHVSFEKVVHIPRSPSGKFRFVESQVPLRVGL